MDFDPRAKMKDIDDRKRYPNFKGTLIISPSLNESQIRYAEQFMGKSRKVSPVKQANDNQAEWPRNKWYEEIYSIDLMFTPDHAGILWNGREKTHDMVAQVNYFICAMKNVCTEIALSGHFEVQGEDADDCWKLIINRDGEAKRVHRTPTGIKTTCPQCGHTYYYDEEV